MASYTPPQYVSEATPRGALVRALNSEYPHSLPADMDGVMEFVARWVLLQDRNRAYLGISEAVATLENWHNERRGMLS